MLKIEYGKAIFLRPVRGLYYIIHFLVSGRFTLKIDRTA